MHYALALALVTLSTAALADARSDYYQRAAATDMASFQALDTDHDNQYRRYPARTGPHLPCRSLSFWGRRPDRWIHIRPNIGMLSALHDALPPTVRDV